MFQSSEENTMSAEIIENEMIIAKPNSAVASQPCSSGHIIADKREIKDFPKLPSATSFIREPLYAISLWCRKG
ncbi:MAG: hypothetical protein COS84_10820, partial [Armatimonadetes bacterium CG07_land_8_20_14_0_80_40_9]